MRKLLTITSLFFAINALAQFTGHSGVYYLGTANIPISTTQYSNPNISGAVVRCRWNDIESTPGNFNWSFVDGEIAKAVTYNKKISLQPLGKPDWLDSIGVQKYFYIEKSTFSPNFGQVVSDIIPWDSIYVKRYKQFLVQMANKYANNPVVTYVNAVGGNFSRGLPDTVIVDTVTLAKQAFWVTYNYNADTLGHLMNNITDYYMSLFPTTPMWCSVDYVTYQPNASGQPRNYLASIYCNYGITNYPDRFGLFREDISGCNPNFSNIATTSHWYIMQQNPCRTGAQMLWNVQDGPARMNQCGILPNTKSVVLDSAVKKGLALGMRYLEIYGSDIADASLVTSIQQANTNLIAKGLFCNPTTGFNEPTIEKEFSIYPNPANDNVSIILPETLNYIGQISILNSLGMEVKTINLTNSAQFNIAELPIGLYFVKLKNYPNQQTKFIIQ
ncbi:MAG: T9SS type A sorting domain-containing protein [Bacteroidota bacterium]|nr:T9SS type A sorting domain-containing protein [Bacteroidota bacterium]